MEAIILNYLKEKRELVESRFNSLGENACISKKDFFQIVFDRFENISKVMLNKILKDNYKFIYELNKAIEIAEYKAHEASRRSNYNMMIRNQRTGVYNG